MASHLALRTFLRVPLAVLDDAGPRPEQLVSFPVLPAFEAVVPRRVTPEAPHKLAAAALDLPHKLGGKSETHSALIFPSVKNRSFATGAHRADWIGSQISG